MEYTSCLDRAGRVHVVVSASQDSPGRKGIEEHAGVRRSRRAELRYRLRLRGLHVGHLASDRHVAASAMLMWAFLPSQGPIPFTARMTTARMYRGVWYLILHLVYALTGSSTPTPGPTARNLSPRHSAFPVQIIGRDDMTKIVRMQFARMKPGTEIKLHKDMGGYAMVGGGGDCGHEISGLVPIVSVAQVVRKWHVAALEGRP